MYRLIVDSACDLTKEMEMDMNILSVPFKIDVDDIEYVDNENLDMENFLNAMKSSPNPIRTSTPSIFDYLEKLRECEEDNIFILTISDKLSGSYNIAMMAKDEFMKECPDKKVHIFDSKSASAGETIVALEIYEVMKEDSSFEQKVDKITNFINENKTFFILESLDNLMKNGRIKKSAGLIVNVLNIKPIMTTDNGEIVPYEMHRGFKKSLSTLAVVVGKTAKDFSNKTLVISHVDAVDKAREFEKKIRASYNFKNIIILHTKGLASGYADNGGIVIGF